MEPTHIVAAVADVGAAAAKKTYHVGNPRTVFLLVFSPTSF